MSFESRLRTLTRVLGRPAPPGVFHPYLDHDPALDLPDGAERRLGNLRAYLRAHGDARWVLVGEAAGYNGCRFSGIPFTGEDLLVGESPLPWTDGHRLRRSSVGEALKKERSAAIVWEGIRDRRDCVLWNTVPWHPHRPREPLSNRPPRRPEVEAGLAILPTFLALFPEATPVAIGRVAEAGLERIGVPSRYVRHPSMGGKNAFLAGVAALGREVRQG
ncbi:MAG: uracil-DNA glycosylase [Planctomycetota bacterium]|jgi:hypothetical protein